MQPTKKQLNRIKHIVNYIGEPMVREYFYKHFPNSNYDFITRKQAQKIITGLAHWLPRKPILGVVGRDIRPVHIK